MTHQEKVCIEKKDVISDLPNAIMERILEGMPLRDAGRTSILSRKWRHSWKTLPQLVFSRDFFESAAGGNFLRDFHAVFLLHAGPITNVVLQIPQNSLPMFDDHVDLLVLLLSRNYGIKRLTLENLNHVYVHKVPSSLFSCLKLTHLKLHSYTFQPLPAFKGFQLLSSLDFYDITIPSNVLEMLISSSPFLKNFTLDLCHVVNRFVIHAPKLSFLRIHGAYKFSLRETPNLAVAFLHLTKMNGPLVKESCNLKRIVRCSPRIERLVVGQDTLEILVAAAIRAKQLTIRLVCLTYLEIHETSLCTEFALMCAVGVIAFSPKLRELKISYSRSPFNLQGRDYQLPFTRTLPLQIIRLQHIKGFVQELELIKYLLAYSPMLQSMVIERSIDIPSTNEIKLLRGLLQYPRASPKVKITYLEPSAGLA